MFVLLSETEGNKLWSDGGAIADVSHLSSAAISAIIVLAFHCVCVCVKEGGGRLPLRCVCDSFIDSYSILFCPIP